MCNFELMELYCKMNIWGLFILKVDDIWFSYLYQNNVLMLLWDKKFLFKYNYINVCYEIFMKDIFNWNYFQIINFWLIWN